ncbi:hypothetical protein DFJ74DRAFT_707025 [Hyaloraphidium curvatum]|nr:hypothetical protein DFJ74DRAFT_707025 [Hyaloraphidium curvatum]
MVFSIKGKHALVTGGTEGIGLAIVERLLGSGIGKVVIANRNEKLGAEMVAALGARFGRPDGHVSFVRMDVCDVPSIKAGFDAAVARLDGALDVVVANAGFSTTPIALQLRRGVADDFSAIAGNLVGTVYLGNLATLHWLARDAAGAFVSSSSGAGLQMAYGGPGTGIADPTYPAAKAGINSWTVHIQSAVDGLLLARKRTPGIRYAAILPGVVFTPFFPKVDPTLATEEAVKRHPFFSASLAVVGGFTPMSRLVDAYVRCIEDEGVRGAVWVVAGEAGEPVPYPGGRPGPHAIMDYISFGSTEEKELAIGRAQEVIEQMRKSAGAPAAPKPKI